jgi:hypothetical protein
VLGRDLEGEFLDRQVMLQRLSIRFTSGAILPCLVAPRWLDFELLKTYWLKSVQLLESMFG